MSSFLQNKQNLIMIGHFVVFAGVSFYFHKRIKAVVYNINELHKMILSQQEQINKQNAVIESLRMIVLSGSSIQRGEEFIPTAKSQRESTTGDVQSKTVTSRKEVREREDVKQPKINQLPEALINSALIFKTVNQELLKPQTTTILEVIDEDEQSSENDIDEILEEKEEDLDAELEKELNELQEE